MKVIATDADQENTLHSKMFYRIAEQSNTAGMFFINSQTGEVMVQQSSLDREVSHSTDPRSLQSSVTASTINRKAFNAAVRSVSHSKSHYNTTGIFH